MALNKSKGNKIINYLHKKNKVTKFAAFKPRTILLICGVVAFFIASNSALYAVEYGLPNSNCCCTSQSVIVLGRTEKGSLSSFKYFNFSLMPRTMRNYSSTKYSNADVTPDCESVARNKTFFISDRTRVVLENDPDAGKIAAVYLQGKLVIYLPLSQPDRFINFISCFEEILLLLMPERDILIKLERYEDLITLEKTKRSQIRKETSRSVLIREENRKKL